MTMVDFCSIDPRLLPVGWVPMASITQAVEVGREAIATGVAALMIPSLCPRHQGPSPLKRFDAALDGLDDASRTGFFSANFADMMGLDVPSA